MRHNMFDEVFDLVNVNVPVLLTGEKGSGKTTIGIQMAEELKLKFYTMSMTRQTTLSHLLGFMSVNGKYIPSLLREAVENGGVFLLDEIDAGDPNVLLALNTIENGYVSFPTGTVHCHEDFRLIATANPQDQHQHYTGRAKLDAATLDRFDIIPIPRDEQLEARLVDGDTLRRMNLLRTILKETNSSRVISMRDSMRYQKRKELGRLKNHIENLVDQNEMVIERYEFALKNLPKHNDQSECTSIEELVDLAEIQSGVKNVKQNAKTEGGGKSKQDS